ncbi:prepilin peptidase [Nocardia australiensis]|uniref:prepilin peptidase n=1 Tax=Nocardia australiensis TaxID=2887191 RepID=UPI001D137E1D|nr:A24 family peptidase [Nocardia australiensis]
MHIAAFTLLVIWCALLSFSDIRERRLPNALTWPGALAILGYALYTAQFVAAVVGAVLLTTPYLMVHIVAPAAFGAGDVKLAAGLGAAAALGGAQAWVWAAAGAPVLTAGAGVVVLSVHWIRRRDAPTRPHTLAHGPAMCVATVLALTARAG